MEKVMENGVDKISTFTNQNIMELNSCFHSILDTCKNMNGKFIFAMHKNINIIEPFLKKINIARDEIVDKLVEKDENGEPKQEADESGTIKFIYTDKNEEKAKKEFTNIMLKKHELNFHKIHIDVFEKVTDIDINKITALGSFMDHIIVE